MLGKQWLNRYASTDVRGTAIERSQNRQRKLDGIVAWRFDYVMESLPLMLQIALLLLGCALSRYLWEINTTVASVLLGVTSFGVIFYIFIIAAGTASESCPYQTPGARIFRNMVLPALRSAPSVIYERSIFVFSKLSGFMRLLRFGLHEVVAWWWSFFNRPWYSVNNITIFSLTALILPLTASFWGIIGLATVVPLLPVALVGWMIYRRFMGASPQIMLDLRCISWMLQTSLDKAVRLSALKHLAPLMSTPTDFDPTLVAYCFNVFVGCINIGDRDVVIIQGLEQLATVSAQCFFHTISHLSVMDPTSGILKDVCQRYTKVFSANINFHGHQFSDHMNAIHRVFIQGEFQRFKWSDYRPPGDEYTLVSDTLTKLARFKCQKMEQPKVPNSILRFALHSLFTDPLPPIPIIADCLSIIAIDLDCDISNTGGMVLEERCVFIPQMPITLTSG